MITWHFICFLKNQTQWQVFRKRLKLNHWNITQIRVWTDEPFVLPKRPVVMKWTSVGRPGPVHFNTYLHSVKYEHCLQKYGNVFIPDIAFSSGIWIGTFIGHLGGNRTYVEILKFYLILGMCKIYCWCLFWISRFKFQWGYYCTNCLERFLWFKYLINPRNTDTYSLIKNDSLEKI